MHAPACPCTQPTAGSTGTSGAAEARVQTWVMRASATSGCCCPGCAPPEGGTACPAAETGARNLGRPRICSGSADRLRSRISPMPGLSWYTAEAAAAPADAGPENNLAGHLGPSKVPSYVQRDGAACMCTQEFPWMHAWMQSGVVGHLCAAGQTCSCGPRPGSRRRPRRPRRPPAAAGTPAGRPCARTRCPVPATCGPGRSTPAQRRMQLLSVCHQEACFSRSMCPPLRPQLIQRAEHITTTAQDAPGREQHDRHMRMHSAHALGEVRHRRMRHLDLLQHGQARAHAKGVCSGQ